MLQEYQVSSPTLKDAEKGADPEFCITSWFRRQLYLVFRAGLYDSCQ